MRSAHVEGVLLGDWPVRFVSDQSTIDLERQGPFLPTGEGQACLGLWGMGQGRIWHRNFSFFILFFVLVWGPFYFLFVALPNLITLLEHLVKFEEKLLLFGHAQGKRYK